jgi:hypothetical protein
VSGSKQDPFLVIDRSRARTSRAPNLLLKIGKIDELIAWRLNSSDISSGAFLTTHRSINQLPLASDRSRLDPRRTEIGVVMIPSLSMIALLPPR